MKSNFWSPEVTSPFQRILAGLYTASLVINFVVVVAYSGINISLLAVVLWIVLPVIAICFAYINNWYSAISCAFMWAALLISRIFGVDTFVTVMGHLGHIWFVLVPLSIVYHARMRLVHKRTSYSIALSLERFFIGFSISVIVPLVVLFLVLPLGVRDMQGLVNGIVALSLMSPLLFFGATKQPWFTDTHLLGWFVFTLLWGGSYALLKYDWLVAPYALMWISLIAATWAIIYKILADVISDKPS